MDPNMTKMILTHPSVIGLLVFVRTFIGALFLCGGLQLFDFKRLDSFFTRRKIFGLFLLISGVRILLSVLFFTTPLD